MIEKRKWRDRNMSVLGLYYHLCTYGENIVKPVLWLVAIIILGSVYWAFFYYFEDSSQSQFLALSNPTILINFSNSSFNYTTINSSKSPFEIILHFKGDLIFKPIERTFKNIVSFNEESLVGDIAIRIASVIVLGAIGITIRRKIERRFRH